MGGAGLHLLLGREARIWSSIYPPYTYLGDRGRRSRFSTHANVSLSLLYDSLSFYSRINGENMLETTAPLQHLPHPPPPPIAMREDASLLSTTTQFNANIADIRRALSTTIYRILLKFGARRNARAAALVIIMARVHRETEACLHLSASCTQTQFERREF